VFSFRVKVCRDVGCFAGQFVAEPGQDQPAAADGWYVDHDTTGVEGEYQGQPAGCDLSYSGAGPAAGRARHREHHSPRHAAVDLVSVSAARLALLDVPVFLPEWVALTACMCVCATGEQLVEHSILYGLPPAPSRSAVDAEVSGG
jgi:hypothetical protein